MYTQDRQLELTELVRQYARALINYYKIPPYEYQKSPSKLNKRAEFGKTTKSDVKKARRKKKNGKSVAPTRVTSSVVKNIQAGGKTFSDKEMAQLAQQARQAIQQACKLAGEPVVYCCGLLRIKSRINYECTCEQSKRHTIINSLAASEG